MTEVMSDQLHFIGDAEKSQPSDVISTGNSQTPSEMETLISVCSAQHF